ncbi:hypothetical protein N1027_11260 [Herbiconiux sp. CPCC 205763]|uniref:Uncharacterized protein n=1 Tax=Herbiconiux aconitum TaxID=2970913 RepID=A0ABT2GTS9_9MICO|nr:hypothetical protein [Herbiconiux aconitum]MCS5718710.1 hypothetical protein [Herbiconiux aconitum]
MDKGYWTDEVAALAVMTPVDEIHIDEIPSEQLRRLAVILEEIRHDRQPPGPAFEVRYRQIRHLLETGQPD